MQKNENKNNIKTTRSIYREANEKNLQFWCSVLEKNGRYGIVATNLPVVEDENGEFFPQRSELEHYGVGLNAARVTAEEKGYQLMTMKVVIDYTEQKDNSVIVYKVTPKKKEERWVYDMERVSYFRGGFPKNIVASKLARKQLNAFGIEPESFVGEVGDLKPVFKKTDTKKENRKQLREAIASLSDAWPEENKD